MHKMDKIQLYTTLLAIVSGTISNQYHFDNSISIGIPTLIYIAFVFFVSGYYHKSIKKIFSDTILTYFLVWFVIWTILFNVTSFL